METVANWGVRPVFITSTFQDMTAERNWLWAIVAPAIEAELRRYRRHLEWIDLRLGADAKPTETEAEREALVLKVCLDEVRRSRPFLVALIGDRYGWVPPHDRAKAAAQEAGITGDVAGRSVTDLEIDFGVFHDPDQRRRSLFFLRQPLPYATMGTRAARFSDAHNPDDPGAPDRAVRLTTMKERIRDSFGGHVHSYPAVWDAEASQVVGLEEFGRIVEEAIRAQLTAELGEEAAPSELTWLEQEARALDEFAADRRRDFQGRAALLDDIAEFLVAPTQVDAHWAQCLTGTAGAGKSAVFGEILARLHAVQAVASPPDPGASASMREADQAMRDWITELAVTSPRFVALRGRLHADPVLVLAHAAGASPRAPSVDAMLRRWIGEMAGFLNETVDLPDTADAETVERSFASLLGRAALRRRVVVLIDALDQFEQTPRGRYLTWLPKLWPDNARLFATAIPGEASQALAQRQPAALRPMEALTRDEAREVYAAIHRRYHRAPDLALREVLLARPQEAWSNPLWLYLAVEQLNLLDGDDVTRTEQSDPARMPQRLAAMLRQRAADFPADLPGLYRVTFDHAAGWFPTLAPCFLGLIAVGAGGWRESDFRAVLPGLSGEAWDDLRFAHLRRLFRGQIRPRGPLEQWDVAHAQMRDAIRTWLSDQGLAVEDLHGALARRLLDLPTDDSLRATETMRHLLGAGQLKAAADYYADPALPDAAAAGATRFLTSAWVVETPRHQVRADLARMLVLPELSDIAVGHLANRLLFDLQDAVEGTRLLQPQRDLLDLVFPVIAQLTKSDVGNVEFQRLLSVAYGKAGDVLMAQGDLAGALKSFRDGLAIAGWLTRASPGFAFFQRDLSISCERIGDVLEAQGNLPEALESFRESLAIRAQLVRDDAGNAEWQHNLSASYQRVGSVLAAQDALSEALASFRAGLAIADGLAQAHRSNALWQRDLSVFYNEVGGVLMAQGNLPDALKSFRVGVAIVDRLARADPGTLLWQSDLAICNRRIGDVLTAQGDLKGAMAAYHIMLTINQRLFLVDSKNTSWQHQLWSAHLKVGDTLVAQASFPDALEFFRDGLAIGDRLAETDRSNATWQYDLGITNERMGTLLAIQGNLYGAMRFYRTKLAIIERLARSDKSHTLWQRDLSLSYNKIGDILVAQGNVREALKYFRDGLAIREQLVRADPSNALWQRDRLISGFKIAEAVTKGGDYVGARVEVMRALTMSQSLVQKFPEVPQFGIDLQMIQNLRTNIERAQGR